MIILFKSILVIRLKINIEQQFKIIVKHISLNGSIKKILLPYSFFSIASSDILESTKSNKFNL